MEMFNVEITRLIMFISPVLLFARQWRSMIWKKPHQQMSDYISNAITCRRAELFRNFDNCEETYDSVNTRCDICNDLSVEFILLLLKDVLLSKLSGLHLLE